MAQLAGICVGVCVALLLGLAAAAPTPVWHEQFAVSFNETTHLLFSWRTTGVWFYDAVNNREAIFRDNGRGDRYCKSIHPYTDTPCHHVVTGDRRYLIFPKLNECCMCCTSEGGCGVLAPNWLDNATFNGITELHGEQVYFYQKSGLQPNYVYLTADDDQIPIEIDQVPTDYMTFKPKSFKTGPPHESLFSVPADCKAKCPLTSLCTFLKGDKDQDPVARS